MNALVFSRGFLIGQNLASNEPLPGKQVGMADVAKSMKGDASELLRWKPVAGLSGQ